MQNIVILHKVLRGCFAWLKRGLNVRYHIVFELLQNRYTPVIATVIAIALFAKIVHLYDVSGITVLYN